MISFEKFITPSFWSEKFLCLILLSIWNDFTSTWKALGFTYFLINPLDHLFFHLRILSSSSGSFFSFFWTTFQFWVLQKALRRIIGLILMIIENLFCLLLMKIKLFFKGKTAFLHDVILFFIVEEIWNFIALTDFIFLFYVFDTFIHKSNWILYAGPFYAFDFFLLHYRIPNDLVMRNILNFSCLL